MQWRYELNGKIFMGLWCSQASAGIFYPACRSTVLGCATPHGKFGFSYRLFKSWGSSAMVVGAFYKIGSVSSYKQYYASSTECVASTSRAYQKSDSGSCLVQLRTKMMVSHQCCLLLLQYCFGWATSSYATSSSTISRTSSNVTISLPSCSIVWKILH